MAKEISWLPRLHEIRKSVAGSVRSHYTRADLQRLFQVQARTAGRMLGLLATDGVGDSHMVRREVLQRFLDEVHAAEPAAVPGVLGRLRARAAPISRRKPRHLVRRDTEPMTFASLPGWVQLAPGEFSLTFTSPEQLVDGLIRFATVLADPANDAELVRLCRPERAADPDAALARQDLRTLHAELHEIEQRRRPAAKVDNWII